MVPLQEAQGGPHDGQDTEDGERTQDGLQEVIECHAGYLRGWLQLGILIQSGSDDLTVGFGCL